MPHVLTIGQLSKETHCKVPTIRYYEQIGLIPAPSRTAGNQRRYGPEHVARLGFILHCRELGFHQQSVRELLELTKFPKQNCEAVAEIARTHLGEVIPLSSAISSDAAVNTLTFPTAISHLSDCWRMLAPRTE